MSRRAALLVVDLQHDFLAGGALAVPDGDALIAPISDLVGSAAFPVVVATQDWHPPGHASFASSHPGRRPFEEIALHGRPQVLWPDHCVQGSPGAALHPGLPRGPLTAIFRKGADPDVDSYSAFRHNLDARGERPPTGLAGFLRELEIDEVVIVGLARDYCVRWSAEDAADAGFAVRVVWRLTRAVDPTSDAAVRSASRSATCGSIDLRGPGSSNVGSTLLHRPSYKAVAAVHLRSGPADRDGPGREGAGEARFRKRHRSCDGRDR